MECIVRSSCLVLSQSQLMPSFSHKYWFVDAISGRRPNFNHMFKDLVSSLKKLMAPFSIIIIFFNFKIHINPTIANAPRTIMLRRITIIISTTLVLAVCGCTADIYSWVRGTCTVNATPAVPTVREVGFAIRAFGYIWLVNWPWKTGSENTMVIYGLLLATVTYR